MPREAGATAELWVGRAEQLVAASVVVAWVAAARAAAAKAVAFASTCCWRRRTRDGRRHPLAGLQWWQRRRS